MEVSLEFNLDQILDDHPTIAPSSGNNLNIVLDAAHYMPCSIDFDGEASVDTHFSKYIRINKDKTDTKFEEFIGSFRGYPLKGKIVEAPNDYSFILMKEMKTNEEGRTLRQSEKFKYFTLWNVGSKPCSGDAFQQTLKWIDVAKIVHEN